MGIDDAGGGREEGCHALDVRFETPGLVSRHHLEVIDPVGKSFSVQGPAGGVWWRVLSTSEEHVRE